jgi:anti-sigma regulatory factor (Ser/Thr protein kinase)
MTEERPIGAGPTAGAPLFELELERDVGAPSVARLAFSERLPELGLEGQSGQVLVLLVSEVVSNAVRHSSGPAAGVIRLSVTLTKTAIHVAVSDEGGGFTPRTRDPDRIEDGYGLYLLEKAASSWGVENSGGTTVWFALDRAPAGES